MIPLGSARSRLLPGEHGHPEHRERERREGQARLQSVVLEHHLQEDRQRDHRPAQGDVLEHLSRDPEPEHRRSEQAGVEQGRLLLARAAQEPVGERPQAHRPDDQQLGDGVAAFLPRQDAEDDPAHAEDREDRTDRVDLSRSRVRHVLDVPDPEKDDGDDQELQPEADPPREERRDEATEQRPDRRRDGRRRPDERVDLLLRLTPEVAVDQRLHRGHQQRCAEPADQRPEDDDREDALSEGHRQGARRVPAETDDVGAFAADQVADLAADQDERRRHQRFERDRRLDGADGGVQVVDHGRDRHVHQRRVEHEHEHRHREQDGERAVERDLLGRGRLVAHPGLLIVPEPIPGPQGACRAVRLIEG